MIKQTDLKRVEELFKLGAHLGHKKSRLHPKARKNVYQIVNKTSIIDLTKTVEQLDAAKKYLSQCGKEGKIILVVGTKKTAGVFIRDYCKSHSIPYISSKWLPGFLTNFKTIINNVNKLKDMKVFQESDDIKTVVKHERTRMKKEIGKLEKLYGGIESLLKRPDVLVVVDIKKEKNAVKEAREYSIPVVAIVDTNGDPGTVDYPIVSNDDDSKAVEFVMTELLNEYKIVVEKPVVEVKVATPIEEKKVE